MLRTYYWNIITLLEINKLIDLSIRQWYAWNWIILNIESRCFLHIGMWSSDDCLNEFWLGMSNSAPASCHTAAQFAMSPSSEVENFWSTMKAKAITRREVLPLLLWRTQVCGALYCAPRRVAKEADWMKSRHLRWNPWKVGWPLTGLWWLMVIQII